MIFKPEHLAMILRGDKTQTRRLGNRRWIEGHVHPIKADYYGKPVGYIRILSVQEARLGTITDEDARKEGYQSVSGYRYAWERVYKARWDDALLVWVIEFRLVPQERMTQTNLLDQL